MSGELDRRVDLERRARARPPKIVPRVIGRVHLRPHQAATGRAFAP